MDERTATVNIGGQEYEMLLTTRATKAMVWSADMKRSRHSLMRSPRRSPTKLTAKSCWSSSSTQLRVKRQSRSLMNGCGRVWWIS